MSESPDPRDGRTHYEDCYQDRSHHDCALVEIARLRDALARYETDPPVPLSRYKDPSRVRYLVTHLQDEEALDALVEDIVMIARIALPKYWTDSSAVRRVAQLKTKLRNYRRAIKQLQKGHALMVLQLRETRRSRMRLRAENQQLKNAIANALSP